MPHTIGGKLFYVGRFRSLKDSRKTEGAPNFDFVVRAPVVTAECVGESAMRVAESSLAELAGDADAIVNVEYDFPELSVYRPATCVVSGVPIKRLS